MGRYSDEEVSVYDEESALLPENLQIATQSYNMARAVEGYLSEIKKGNFLLNGEKSSPINWKTVVNALSVSAGLLSGIPWISPSMDAAIIIPNPGALRETVAILFASGIVLTVGADGGYVMYDCLPLEESKSISEAFFARNDSKIKTAIIGVFSILACTSPVYATITYNTGVNRLLSILTAVTSLGYGVYGYKRLVNKSSNFLHDHFALEKRVRKEKSINDSKLLKLLHDIQKNPEILINEDDVSMLVHRSLTNELSTRAQMSKAAVAKLVFQLLGDITIPAATALVTVLLAKEAMQTIWDNPGFYITMTILAELPSYVLSIVSTHNIFGQVFDGVMGIINRNPDISLLNNLYPNLMFGVNIAASLIALTAPSAAAYITYTTIGRFSDAESTGDLDSSGNPCLSTDCLNNGVITWGSVAAISLARYILSVFTQKRLSNEAIIAVASRSSDNNISSSAKISKSIGKVLESWDSLEPRSSAEPSDARRNNCGVFSYCTNRVPGLTFLGGETKNTSRHADALEDVNHQQDNQKICILM